jgi:hypothetical protein
VVQEVDLDRHAPLTLEREHLHNLGEALRRREQMLDALVRSSSEVRYTGEISSRFQNRSPFFLWFRRSISIATRRSTASRISQFDVTLEREHLHNLGEALRRREQMLDALVRSSSEDQQPVPEPLAVLLVVQEVDLDRHAPLDGVADLVDVGAVGLRSLQATTRSPPRSAPRGCRC